MDINIQKYKESAEEIKKSIDKLSGFEIDVKPIEEMRESDRNSNAGIVVVAVILIAIIAVFVLLNFWRTM